MIRENAGYLIKTAEEYYCSEDYDTKYEIVLGVNTHGYVTWECKNGTDYFWGHYFGKDQAELALADYHTRLAENYKNHAPF